MTTLFSDFFYLLEGYARTQPNKLACIFLEDQPKKQYSYSQLYIRAKAIAASLQCHSPQNERVLILLPQSLDYVAAFLGCLFAGLVAVPAYPPFRANLTERVEIIAKDAMPRFVIAEAPIIAMLCDKAWATDSSLIFIDIASITDDLAEKYRSVEMNELAFLQYSSGSTGNPKGVMVTHQNLLNNFEMMNEVYKQGTECISVSWLPLFHDLGLIIAALLPLYLGGTVYLMSPSAFIKSPLRWLQAISNYRGVMGFAPDFAYKMCSLIPEEDRRGLDLSSWKIALNAAEPIRRDTVENFYNAYKDFGFSYESFCAGYGLAEATVFVTSELNQGPIYFNNKLVACGKSRAPQEMLIVNYESRAECQVGDIGEIWLAGPHITKGYWGKDELNQEVFQAYTNQNRGPFLRTGDLGFIDETGQLYITGRIKDLIIIHGKNYAAHDIEETVYKAHPAISDTRTNVVAFSVEENNEERLMVVIGMRPPYEDANFVEISKAVKKIIYNFHDIVPFKVLFVGKNTITKTSSGKLQRLKVKLSYLQNGLDTLDSKNNTW